MALEAEIKVLKKFGESLVADISQSIEQSGVSASGNLQRSIYYKLTDNRLTVYGAPYAKTAEEGRGPTQKAGGDLRSQIRKWIDDKGIIPDGITKDSLAFLITRKIHREGTELFNGTDFYGRTKPSMVIEGVVQDGRIDELKQDLIKTYVAQIKTLLSA
jgi:hypothetical protein